MTTASAKPWYHGYVGPIIGAALAVVGIQLSVAAMVDIVSNVYGLSHAGFISMFLHAYEDIRDIMFWPLEVLVRFMLIPFHIEFVLPDGFKNFVILYGVPMRAQMRSSYQIRRRDLEAYNKDPVRFMAMIRETMIRIGKNPETKMAEVLRGLQSPWYGHYRAIKGGLMWPNVLRNNFMGLFSLTQAVRENAWRVYGVFATSLLIPLTLVLLLLTLRYLGVPFF